MADSEALERTEQRECVRAIGIRLIHVTFTCEMEEMCFIYCRTRSEISRDYPLNLSISLSGGKETNQDSPSNGE